VTRLAANSQSRRVMQQAASAVRAIVRRQR